MEFCGELTGIGLRPLVNFLADLKKSGRLVLQDDRWTGGIALLEGRLVGADFADERGLAALDAIFFALRHGSFEFTSTAKCEHNILVEPHALAEHLDTLDREVQQLGEVVPSLSAVPARIESISDGEITLTRSALTLLFAVDGHSSVADHARKHGLLSTLRAITELIQLGLVSIQTPATGSDAPLAPVREITTHAFRARGNSDPTSSEGATLPPQRANFWRKA